MEYTEEQIKFIQENYPDFGFKIIPSLDTVVVEFLKKYEVFVKPMTSGTRDVKGDIASGVITGVLGADVGMDAYGVTGQKKQTEVQEWTQWKQWALNHKDFEDFRVEKIELPKAHNLQVLEKLKSPQIQKELEELQKQLEDAQAAVALPDIPVYELPMEPAPAKRFGMGNMGLYVIGGGLALVALILLVTRRAPAPIQGSK